MNCVADDIPKILFVFSFPHMRYNVLADTDVGLVLIVIFFEVDVSDLVLLKRRPRVRVGLKLFVKLFVN